MRKAVKMILAIACSAVTLVGLAGCDFGTEAKSAYQIAVEHGFTGTETEWLQSLHGADGSDGKNLDIKEVYAAAKTEGYSGEFLDFVQEYCNFSLVSDTSTHTIAENVRSVVSVFCSFTKTTQIGGYFGIPKYETSIQCAGGSGVIYELNKKAGNAYILTNYHVLYDASSDDGFADNIYLYLYGAKNGFDKNTGKDEDGDGILATYVGGSMEQDVAVLKVEGNETLKNSAAVAATIGCSEDVTLGEQVYAIGNPEGEGISVTKGIISVESEEITLKGADEKTSIRTRVMRTDASINSGNSGGALFNARGELIGITNAKRMDSTNNSVDNMGYALPIDKVMAIAGNIVDNGGQVKRALLGITIRLDESKAVYDETAKKTRIVEVNSVAEIIKDSAGVGHFEVGDIVKAITVHGETTFINRRHQIIDKMFTVRLGDTVTVTVERDGEEKTLEIVFDKEAYFSSVA